MLTNGRGVCSAYTLLFDVLCRTAGLQTRIVFSEKTYAVTGSTFNIHCWNMVCIDGVWYHVDVTWDDQPHLGNGVVYNYFLKSSDYFMRYNHIWDDREDGFGTPYPEANKNNGAAPGGSGSDNITRPIEGEKPKVVERVIGLESSVPEPIELPDENSSVPAPIASSDNSGESGSDGSFLSSPIIYVLAGAVFAAAVAVVAIIVAKHSGRSKQPPEESGEQPKNEKIYDSYDSYDGFDS